MKFEKHAFICTNQRPPDAKKSCGEACGLGFVTAFKKSLKEKGLNVKIRAQKSGCLDACEFGPAMVVYPEGVYYGALKESDIEEIVNEHFIHNRPVERLRLNFTKDISE